MRETVFCDVDGVVADCLGGILKFHDFPKDRYPSNRYDTSDIIGKSYKDTWLKLGRDFWANLEPMPWAGELVDGLLSMFGRDHFCFLTKPVEDPDCAAGKQLWLQREFHGLPFLIGPTKSVLAHAGTWLVDDLESNIHSWAMNGGDGILFPAKTNKLHEASNPVDVKLYLSWLDAARGVTTK